MTGVRLGPGAFAYQRIISNDSYAHDEQGDNPGQEKEGSTVSLSNLKRITTQTYPGMTSHMTETAKE